MAAVTSRRAAQVMGQQLRRTSCSRLNSAPALQQQQHQHQAEPAEDGVYQALLSPV